MRGSCLAEEVLRGIAEGPGLTPKQSGIAFRSDVIRELWVNFQRSFALGHPRRERKHAVALQDQINRIKVIISDVDGVLTDGSMFVDAAGQHCRVFHVRDGVGFALWRHGGGWGAVMSGLGSKALEAIAKQWKLEACLMHVKNKRVACEKLAGEMGVGLGEMAFIADDLIDLAAMEVVGLSIAVADADPAVRKAADLVLATPGGRGALREAVETLLERRGELEAAQEAYRTAKLADQ